MRVSVASQPGSPDVPNEDWCGVSPRVIVVLDGVTVPEVMNGGCIHGTPWYVRQLGRHLMCDAEDYLAPLSAVLALGIEEVAALHAACDLGSVGSPSAAVAMLRLSETTAEYLVLADVTIALDTAEGVQVFTDGRVAASVAGVDPSAPDVGERIAGRRAADRNRPGGYWVAAADPAAASHSVRGSVPAEGLRRAAVMTDGAARAAEMFGEPWESVMRMTPAGLIQGVRLAEARDRERRQWPRFKTSDDATVVLWEA